MAYSIRIFIVGQDDTIYRLALTKFTDMFDDPENHPMLRFSGQRVRGVEAIVELRDRVPYNVARLIYEMFRFDQDGKFDRNTLVRQNFALVEHSFDAPPTNKTVVINASHRFVARGGQWKPSQKLERKIHQAALGEEKYLRL